MKTASQRILYWAPRAVSIAFICFLSLFALDVFGEGLGFWETAAALAIHLIPTFVLIGVVALAWRWEWIGALLFALAGTLYAVNVIDKPLPPGVKLTWIASIATPAFLIAALFLLGWLKRKQLRT